MSKRDWKPLHVWLNVYFNDIFVKNKKDMSKLVNDINKNYKIIDRIKNGPNTYVNDEFIINEKQKNIKAFSQKHSDLKGMQKRLIKYTMNSVELNSLVLALNNEIMNEVLLGKIYNIPHFMGRILFKYVSFNNRSQSINWAKSCKNLDVIIEREAPELYHKYRIEKSISKKNYFKLSKAYTHPIIPKNRWMVYNDGGDWLYISWFPNYKFINKFTNFYRFKFTAYNNMPNLENYETVNVLAELDTQEKILNCRYIGNINKSIYLQLNDPDYKHKILF